MNRSDCVDHSRKARSDRTGFNFPAGIAVMAPTGGLHKARNALQKSRSMSSCGQDESFFGPTIAAVFRLEPG